MKGMKKLLSILMVLTLVLSLGASALAATITIDEKLTSEGHTFTAYQIFTGTQDASYNSNPGDNPDDNAPLGDIEWGSGINASEFVKALKDIGIELTGVDETNPDAKAVAKAIGGASIAPTLIAEAAAKCLKEPGTPFNGPSVTVADGYYLIKDTTENLNGNKAYNDVVLQVTKDINVQYKTDVPTSEKKVQDINDSQQKVDGTNPTGWQKSADWDIGDHVPFQFTGTLPSNYGDYGTYAITFHDKQSAGLTYDKDSIHAYYVKADDTRTEIGKASYSIVTEGLTDGCTFEVKFADLKKIKDTSEGDITTDATGKIVVEYTSTLNEGAKIGIEGNPNEMTMDFSNNAHGDGTGTTPESTVIVFTFDLDVNKTDGENKPLAGAEFTLYKEVPSGTDGAFQLTAKGEKVTAENGTEPKLEGEKWYIENPNKLTGTTGDDSTSFKASGLDDGNYVIVETKTPAGYNTADPTKFTIEANHLATSEAQMTGDQLTITGISKKSNNSGAETTVINEQGPVLPETGGIGTTIFYVAGAILVAGAAILLVTKKRVNGAEK